MANKLPPMPVGIAPGSSYWNDWYEKLRTMVNNGLNVLFSSLNFTGSNLTSLATRNHNDLQNIQGGALGDNYHLTAAQVVSVTTPTTFIPLTLLNSWVYYGAPYGQAEYTKDLTGRVTMRGLIKNGIAVPGTIICNLPTGYRPPSQLLINIVSNNALGVLLIDTAGNVTVSTASTSWISFDGLSFRV